MTGPARVLVTGAFMPHGHCYLWQPGMVWLQVLSNGFIAAAYAAISLTLAYLVFKIRDIPFKLMYLAFGIFIIACGVTHIFDMITIWTPVYWADGWVRALTAVASVGTALALPPLIPRAVALARGAQAAHKRGIELETMVKDLGTLYERARELEQLKTQFFANVSHELRTPLALILGPTERLLSSDTLDEEQRRNLETVDRNGRTLLKHVNDLLDVSKLEAGKMRTDYVATDVSKLARFCASHFESLAQERGMEFWSEAPASLRAEVDADKFQRVMLNLLSNAFKFTPSGGRIRWMLRENAGRAVLSVGDSGPGIHPENRELVFGRFRQVDAGATRRFGGTGLGLAISKDFVELHGGTIEIGDAPEGGALFTVSLPLTAPPGAEVRKETTTQLGHNDPIALLEELKLQPDAVPAAEFGDRALVLVVEDNPEMNRFIAGVLGVEFRIATAFDGATALAMAEEHVPDLILTDLMMPGMSGDQLVQAIRGRSELDAVPVVLLTAKADDEVRVRLLREGAQDFVTKPFSAAELRARVTNLITMKRVREILQRELQSHMQDLEALSHEVTLRQRELQAALESMRAAREHAERASRFKADFLGLVSHELRTPLSALQLQLERLRREQGGGTGQQHVVERMQIATDRLMDQIDSLLEYARLDRTKLEAVHAPFDIAVIAREVIEELRPSATQKGLEIGLRSGESAPRLTSDVRLVRLILSNLVGNAVKFTQRGRVDISIERSDDHYRLAIQDTGPGIAAEDRARIFEPFLQLAELPKKHLPGIGLGLALVRDMIVTLGGSIELESQVGVGSRFVVTLPAEAAAAARAGLGQPESWLPSES